MTYKVMRIEIKTEAETNYGGGYTMEDVKAICRGYKDNGLFWERANGKYIFMVEAE